MGITNTKAAGAFAPAALPSQFRLLNGNNTLHVEREVRRAVIRVRAGLDVAERNRDRLASIHLHVAGELSHLVGSHVRIELWPYICRNRRGVECDVVGASAYDDELYAIALPDGKVGRLEPVTLRIADHIHRLGRASDRGHCARARRRGARTRRRSGSRRSGRINCNVCRIISRLLLTARASAEREYSNSNRESVELHLLWPPRAVQ